MIIFEKVEDEIDIIIAQIAFEEYKKDSKTYTHEEAWKEILK